MIRLDLSYFYRLSHTFSELRHLPEGVENTSVWLSSYQAQLAISSLFQDETIRSSIKGLLASGDALYKALGEIVEGDVAREFSSYDEASLIGKLDAFEAVLTGELSVSDAYFVLEKPPFSTARLIADGESLFSASLKNKVPEAMVDLKEAGKCLAFELPTASGFHIMRAMEMVLRRYWEVVSGNKPHPKQRNIGVYI